MKIFFCFLLLFFCFGKLASASYVLPYPSVMPGNKLYNFYRLVDYVKEYWFWGNIAKSKYYLSISDKFLVEAKTLFEYQQYLLAVSALEKSDEYWSKIQNHIEDSFLEGKNIELPVVQFSEAAKEHERILLNLEKETPKDFLWQPEKKQSTNLELHSKLQNSLRTRKEFSLSLKAFYLCVQSISSTKSEFDLYKICQKNRQEFLFLVENENK